MPYTEVHVFCEAGGRQPLNDWLSELEELEPRAYAKCLERILSLEQNGYELRRPIADILRDGVYELRMNVAGVQYRILYGFIGKSVALLSHGITKEKEVPSSEIDKAKKRLKLANSHPDRHIADFEIE